jgi:hypothetical protein
MARTAEFESRPSAPAHAGGGSAYIRSGTELAAHLRSPGRAAAYRSLLQDLGVDTGIVPEDEARPGLLFAEQPGCWFTARDRIRVRILETLVTRGWFDWQRSGVYALADDRFTGDGDKAVFLAFELCSSLGPVRVLGSTFIRRNRRRTYSSLTLEGAALDRLRAVFDVSRDVLAAAAAGEAEFVARVQSLRALGLPYGLEALLPPDDHSGRLSDLCGRITGFQALEAASLLEHALARLEPGVRWESFWNEVNGRFLRATVQRLGPLLNRLLLAIKDPVRTAETLSAVLGLDAGEPVSVAGAALRDDLYRMVWFDPASRGFFLERDDDREPVAWEEIRGVAMAGGPASPSGVLEYLLLAATGHYLIVDPGDHFQPFHARACATHELYTGRKFPWLTFPADDQETGSPSNSFLEAYHPRFARRADAVLKTFLTE